MSGRLIAERCFLLSAAHVGYSEEYISALPVFHQEAYKLSQIQLCYVTQYV